MGITQASVHLPDRRVADKELRQAGRARGFSALRIPWWDEDPMTLAIEAALALEDALDGARTLHLCTDAPTQQPGLAPLALDLDAPVIEHTGPEAGLEALVAIGEPEVPTILMAGGSRLGGAGVALAIEPGQGVAVTGNAQATAGGLAGRPSTLLSTVLDDLDAVGPICMPPGRLERKAPEPGPLHAELGKRVGDAGAAGALVDLVDHLATEDGPRRAVSTSRSQAIGATLGPGQVPVTGLGTPAHDTTVAAWEALTGHEPVAWAEASQGAYVSEATYEADPVQRYGARATGPGTVAAVTTIQAGPPGEFQRQHDAGGPYDVAIVDLDEPEGKRVIGQVASPPGELAIGDRVTPVLRRLFRMEGKTRYAVKWRVDPSP